MNQKEKIISLDDFNEGKKSNQFIEIAFNGVVRVPVDKTVKSLQDVDLDILKRDLKGSMRLYSMEVKTAKIIKL